jgi:hypothetical protein
MSSLSCSLLLGLLIETEDGGNMFTRYVGGLDY